MKKYFFMAVAGMLALSSCSNDNDPIIENNNPHAMTFTAGYADGADTRATMDFSTKKVSFDANDKISILGTNNANCQFTTSAGGASAAFVGEANNDSKFYAVYPYTAGLNLDSNTIHGVKIPTEQFGFCAFINNGILSKWNNSAPIALAVAGPGEVLQFRNLCALLKVGVWDDGDWTGIQITANESLTGTFDLDTSTGVLTATAGQNSVGTNSDAISIGYCTAYAYFAVAPGTYSNFKLSVNNDLNGTQSKSKSSVTFEAGKVYDLGTYNFED